LIADTSDVDEPKDTSLTSHTFDTIPTDFTPLSDPHSPLAADRLSRLRSHPLRYRELVAHISVYPPVLVTACCDPEEVKAKEDIFEQPSVPGLITGPHHIPACATPDAIALLSTRGCVEPKTT
jgi:hypothetical protein